MGDQQPQVGDSLRGRQNLVERVEFGERPFSTGPAQPACHLEHAGGPGHERGEGLIEPPAVVVDELVDPGVHARRHGTVGGEQYGVGETSDPSQSL